MKRATQLVLCILSFLEAASQQDTAFLPYSQKIPGINISFKLVPISSGTFLMGSDARDKFADKDETPKHSVKISAFWMGAYEVTYDEYEAFTQDENYSQNSELDAITRPSQPYIDMTLGMGKAGGYPANSMQQYGALMYCKWLFQKTGIFFRLPTEAEWEYGSRAGATTPYPFASDLSDLPKYAWFKNNSGNRYHKVGELKPNAWGLYDMLGNVAEWTMDQYDENSYGKFQPGTSDPVVLPTSRHPRTVKGGSFRDEAEKLRPADRLKSDLVWNRRDPQEPKSKWWNADAPFVGFRIVRPFIQPSKEEIDQFFKMYLDN